MFPGKIVDISSGRHHSMILDTAGAIHAFGNNRYGQCGTEYTVLLGNSFILAPTRVSVIDNGGQEMKFKSVLATDNLSMAKAASDGVVYVWGQLYRSDNDEEDDGHSDGTALAIRTNLTTYDEVIAKYGSYQFTANMVRLK